MEGRIAMSMPQRLVTAEQFEQMPDEPGVRLELVRGRVVRMSAHNFEHGLVSSRQLGPLMTFVARHDLGVVLPPTGFTIQRGPDTVREPDLAFVSRARLDAHGRAPGFFGGAPDLAVEVLSPSDRRLSVFSKVQQYLACGARQVWLIDPTQRTVAVYQSGVESTLLTDGDQLTGGDVIPGFSMSVRDLFQ